MLGKRLLSLPKVDVILACFVSFLLLCPTLWRVVSVTGTPT